jgi:hypothetical protein
MADERNNPNPEVTPLNNPTETGAPPRAGDGSYGADVRRRRGDSAPRPAVGDTGEGYPETDNLSYEPEGRDWLTLSRRWIEQNPGLAMVGAAAAGLLIGRLVAAAIPEPEPETFTEKVDRRARLLAKEGRYAASDAGEAVSQQLSVAADALSDAAKAVATGTRRGYSEAKDFGEFLAENIGSAIAARANKWLDTR